MIRRFSKRVFKWTLVGAALAVGVHYGKKAVKAIGKKDFSGERKKKVVILGSGWGALSLVNHLEPGQFDVTVVSPRNYFLFTPLLPSVTVGTVEARSIVEPIRKLMLRHHTVEEMGFLEAECVDVFPEEKRVVCLDKSGIVGDVSRFELEYDVLVVAVGAKSNTFRTPGVEENCFFLKQIGDAQKIRNVLMDLVETASIPDQPLGEQRRLLHVVVVGGGPTGVEFAAEVQDFMREEVSKVYPQVAGNVTVSLVQSQDHILNTYDEQISDYAEDVFQMEHVNLITNSRVKAVEAKELSIYDKQSRETRKVPYGMCVWTTGVAPTSIACKIMEKVGQGRGRALLTDKYLRLKGAEGVFAIGDCSTTEHDMMVRNAEALFHDADQNGDGTLSMEEFKAMMEGAKKKYPQVQFELTKAENNCNKIFAEMDTSGDQKLDKAEFAVALKRIDGQLKSLPATAQVADQQGKYLADLLNRTNGNVVSQTTEELEGKELGLAPFKYSHLGSFAYVGNNKAVLELPLVGAVSGWWTMWLWRAAYASECASWRTRLLVAGDWMKARVFGRDSSRI